MKTRIPYSLISALLSVGVYVVFSLMAYLKSPLPISPTRNWLSDLGNQISNPQGANFYNSGVIACAFFFLIWFTIGLSQWRIKGHIIQRRLLLIAQVGGLLTAFTLGMSGLYPINHLQTHAFWSDINFIFFGISFAFTVAALRYHPNFPKSLMVLGGFAAMMPTLVLLINAAYWLEWVAIGVFMVYILAIGARTWSLRQIMD